MDWKKGELVILNGLLAVVVGIAGDANVPEDHIALWYGKSEGQRVSEDGSSEERPKVYTVPAEYCRSGPEPIYLH